MARIKIEQVRGGSHPSETVVALTTADGRREMLVVDQRALRNNTLNVGFPVGYDQQNDRYLVELPRETLSGTSRVWVASTTLEREEAVA